MNKAKLADLIFKINKPFYYQLRYFLTRHKFANFRHPSNLSEYILSEMLKPEFKRFAPFADKIEVRNYVESKGFKEILPRCYGVWSDANDIDFDKLPSQFALKTNHGCGNHIICRDKSSIDLREVVSSINSTLSQVFSIREPHYQYIFPKAFAEELIDDGNGGAPTDYKFMCVNGDIKCVLVCSERYNVGDQPKLSTFSLDWESLDWIQKHKDNKIASKPQHLEEMIEIAKVLAKDFEFVRVDLYDCPQGVYFGELTFTPASGLMGYFTNAALVQMLPQK